jgi:hypothetical protein
MCKEAYKDNALKLAAYKVVWLRNLMYWIFSRSGFEKNWYTHIYEIHTDCVNQF